MHRRINLPVIVTGNGSLASSHLPNGQALIRKQASASALLANNGNANGPAATTAAANLKRFSAHNNNNNITASLISITDMVQDAQAARQQQQQQQQRDKQTTTVHQTHQTPLKAISWNYSVDVWWDKVMAEASSECEPVWVDAEDPLFILYTR